MMTSKQWQLASGLALLAAVWLGLLPRMAEWPAVRQRVEQLDAAGVNPTATRYTELEAWGEVIDRVERRLASPAAGRGLP